MNEQTERDNLTGGVWLLADLFLNVGALSIVKWLGPDYAASQVVFMRAAVGFVLILPFIIKERHTFKDTPDLPLHLLRVLMSVITLTASFFAIARVPLALFTAVGFTRPIMTMILAAIFLHEWIGAKRWIGAAIAFVGVVIAVNPATFGGDTTGLVALGVVVLSGSAAVIATRRLRDAPPIVLMTFYTAGLAIVTAPFALWAWTPVLPEHLIPLILIGVLAQSAQLCFLRAHFLGAAGFLSVLSYLGLVLSVLVGLVVFNETPRPEFFVGAALVVAAAVWVSLDARKKARTGAGIR
ncbi:MAG: EamA family transporter [Boseongicola sp.]|nr:MAG: EamA family transporter [Boseongicola sp.]